MPDVDSKLASSLRQAKSKPMFFVFVAAGTEGKLLVDKKKISAKDATDAKNECGGGIIYKGRCTGEEGKMIFEVGKEVPATLATLTKKIIKRETGLTFDVEYRLAADLAEDDNETETTEDAAPTTSVPAAPLPPPDPVAARFASRLKALMPVLQKVETVHPNAAGQAKTQMAAGNQAYRTTNYIEANTALDRAEAILKAAVTSPVTESVPTSQQVQGAEVVKRLNALAGAIKTALSGPFAGSVQTLFAKVNGAVKNKEFAGAGSLLDELETLLRQSASAPGGLSVMKLGKARQEWITTRQHAVKEIKRLQSAIEKEFADSEEKKTAVANALKRLDKLIADLNEELDQQLDAVLNATEAQRPTLASTARQTMRKFLRLVEADEIMVDLDGNDILSDMEVTEPLRLKLQAIAAALG